MPHELLNLYCLYCHRYCLYCHRYFHRYFHCLYCLYCLTFGFYRISDPSFIRSPYRRLLERVKGIEPSS